MAQVSHKYVWHRCVWHRHVWHGCVWHRCVWHGSMWPRERTGMAQVLASIILRALMRELVGIGSWEGHLSGISQAV